MWKRLKRQIEERECYMEEVPDEIVGEIMSRLKAHEVAQACTVSRRWRNVGTSILSSGRNLDLDFTDDKFKKEGCITVTNRVCGAMKRHQGSRLDTLRIAFNDHNNQLYRHLSIKSSTEWSQRIFDQWFRIANNKQVTCIDIDIKTCCELVHDPESDRRARPVLSEDVTGTIIGLSFWNRLTTVSLKSVIMFDYDLHLLLSKSPNLETLLLNNVPFTKLELKDTNLKLKRVEILNCAMFKNIHIISAPNLESLKHIPVMDIRTFKKSEYNYMISKNISLQIENAPRLEDMYLGGPLCPNLVLEVQKHAPQLKKLKLNMDICCHHQACWRALPAFPKVGNLKQLELHFTCTQTGGHEKRKLQSVAHMINKFTCLEKLTLEYDIEKVDMADEDCYYVNSHPNEFLQEVKIVGWSGLKSEIEFVLHLIRTSPKLQSLTLDHTPPHISGYTAFSSMKKTEREHQYAALVTRFISCLHKNLLVK